MTQLELHSTRNLRSSRSSSPAVQRPEPTEPLSQQELSLVCTVAREKLLSRVAVNVRAKFRRKDSSSEAMQVVQGKIRKEGIELWGVWDNEPSKEYPFPHADLYYYGISIIDDPPATTGLEQGSTANGLRTSQNFPDGGGTNEAIVNADTVETGIPFGPSANLDPNGLDPYEPITFTPWINAFDDGGFRVRDLMRELREAPEFGLRVNNSCATARLSTPSIVAGFTAIVKNP